MLSLIHLRLLWRGSAPAWQLSPMAKFNAPLRLDRRKVGSEAGLQQWKSKLGLRTLILNKFVVIIAVGDSRLIEFDTAF